MNDKQFEEEIALLKQRVERLESLLSLFVSNGFVPKNKIKEKTSKSQNQKEIRQNTCMKERYYQKID